MMEQRNVLQPLWFFRQTLMFKARLRYKRRGVIFSITKRREGSSNFQEGDVVTVLLSLVEIGKLLLFPHKAVLDDRGNLTFYHQLRDGRDGKGEKTGGKIITFRPKEKGDVEFSVRQQGGKESETVTFTFSAGEWIVLKHYLVEVMRNCFYFSPVVGRSDDEGNAVDEDDVDIANGGDDVSDYDSDMIPIL